MRYKERGFTTFRLSYKKKSRVLFRGVAVTLKFLALASPVRIWTEQLKTTQRLRDAHNIVLRLIFGSSTLA